MLARATAPEPSAGAIVLQGLTETARKGGIAITDKGPATVAGIIVGYVLAFVGVIFFGLMLYGGFLWMTARGNEEDVKKAVEIIKSAILGMIVIFLSYVVTNFVLTQLVTAVAV